MDNIGHILGKNVQQNQPRIQKKKSWKFRYLLDFQLY